LVEVTHFIGHTSLHI